MIQWLRTISRITKWRFNLTIANAIYYHYRQRCFFAVCWLAFGDVLKCPVTCSSRSHSSRDLANFHSHVLLVFLGEDSIPRDFSGRFIQKPRATYPWVVWPKKYPLIMIFPWFLNLFLIKMEFISNTFKVLRKSNIFIN